MATFDEKEFLWEEMYISTKNLMLNKISHDEPFPEEWLKDRKILEDFRWEIADKEPEEIDFDEAMNFYKAIEAKYKSMPDKE